MLRPFSLTEKTEAHSRTEVITCHLFNTAKLNILALMEKNDLIQFTFEEDRARELDRKRFRLACKRPRVRSPRPAHSFVETWS